MADTSFQQKEVVVKKSVVSIIIFILLVIIYLFVEHHEKSMIAPKSIDNFLGIDTSEVDMIVIKKLGGAVTLSRTGDTWYLMGKDVHHADMNAVGQLLSAISGLRVGNAISDNPANQLKFQVDTLTGSTLELYSGDHILSAIVIGKMADYTHTYVRLRDKHEVYLAEGMLTYLFNRPPSSWRDHTILSLNTEDVQSVEIKFAKEDYKIEKSDTLWLISKAPFAINIKADKDSVNSFIRSLCLLKADDFASAHDSTKYTFEKLSYFAKITLNDGSEQLLEIAVNNDKDSENHFLRIPEEESIFLIHKVTWQRLAKSYKELLPPEKNS